MNRSMMPKQVMAYNQGGIASFIPQQTQIMGQPHRLAYVNPQEEQMMLDAGGAGTPGPGGIPAYWLLTEPSTWAGGSNYEPGAGYQGVGNFNASDNDNNDDDNNDDDNNTQTMTVGEYYDNPPETSNDRVGFIDSIAMGTGFKDKTPAYYATTANTIAASQGPKEAQNYLNRLSDDGTISANDWQTFSDAASQVPINEMLQNVGNNDNNNDNTVVVDDGTVDDGTVDGEEEIQYTQMKPFYGGYQPSTRADTLVPSQGRGIGSYLPNPRLDPIFPQQPPPDFDYYIDDGPGFPPIDPGYGKIYPPGYDGRTVPINEPTQVDELRSNFSDRINRIAQTAGYAGNTDLGKALSGGIELTDYTNPLTGVIGEAPVLSGGFNSMEELMAYQNQNPSANLMGEYQRLKALQGANGQAPQSIYQGVGNLFGNEQAPQSMYQGIMG